MSTVLMWIIGILLGVIGVLLGRLLLKFDEVIKGLNKVNEILVAHQTRLDNIDHRFQNNDNRINDHAKRLRQVELKQASCKNFDHAN